MAAESQNTSHDEADPRMQIQEIIEELTLDELNLTEPGNQSLDGKINLLDKIFTEYLEGENEDQTLDGRGKSVDVSQARLDIVAFNKLAAINHQRIRRVAASSWTFRATDFANRIVRLMNVEESSQVESLTDGTKNKLDQMVQRYFNQCISLRPFLGAIILNKVEAVPKERRQRQPRDTQEKVVAQKLEPRKITDITEEDQNTKVAKHVEYIYKCIQSEYRQNNNRPISFYHFVIDPTSYSNSVENIFYVSFLIKDGFVALNKEEGNRLPTLDVKKPKNRESTSQASVHKSQLILNLQESSWKAIVEGLHLTTAAIDPKSKNNTQHKRPRHQ